MALTTVDTAFKTNFTNTFIEVIQQKESRLSGWVDRISVSGDKTMLDTVGTIAMQNGNAQHQLIAWSDPQFTRRKLITTRAYAAIPLEGLDTAQMSADPQGPLMRALMHSYYREVDKIIARAALADVYTGRDGTTLVTAANDGVLSTDCTSTGLTYAKLLEINRRWDNADLDRSLEATMIAITGDEQEDMLLESQLTSGDFTRNYYVESGSVTKAVGHDVKVFGTPADPVLEVVSSVRQCFAMTKGAVTLGILKDIDMRIDTLGEYLDTQQMVLQFTFGAVRNEGKRVQKITTTPTV